MHVQQAILDEFINKLWDYYGEFGRNSLPWRIPDTAGKFDPYRIAVSEVMLQQTQVDRVAVYYQKFIKRFPNPESLAKAKLEEVLALWQGLGYNRRAKYLRDGGKIVMNDYGGDFPVDLEKLRSLPGIGHNTAAAIRVYTLNVPELFIETNVRSVFIHHFFNDLSKVDDQLILEVLKKSLDRHNSREFYWALMDYGTYLKKQSKGINRRSAHYQKQTKFKGSNRELRANILRYISSKRADSLELARQFPDKRLLRTLDDLEKENFLTVRHGVYRIAD